MGSHGVTCHLAEAASPALSYPGRSNGHYSIYPPTRGEKLSRPEPTQVNDLPRVATEVPATPGVSWFTVTLTVTKVFILRFLY